MTAGCTVDVECAVPQKQSVIASALLRRLGHMADCSCDTDGVRDCPEHACSACLGVGLVMGGSGPGAIGLCSCGAVCRHWWVIEPLQTASGSSGCCRFCGATRMFPVELSASGRWNTREQRASA